MVWYRMVWPNRYTRPTWAGKLSLPDTTGMPHLMSEQAVLAATWRRLSRPQVRSTSSQLKAVPHNPEQQGPVADCSKQPWASFVPWRSHHSHHRSFLAEYNLLSRGLKATLGTGIRWQKICVDATTIVLLPCRSNDVA